jgi:hypothetical protein
MTEPLALLALGFALGVAATVTADLLRRRDGAELAELARHQALPAPAAITCDPPWVTGSLPPLLHYHGDTLQIVVWRRRRPW